MTSKNPRIVWANRPGEPISNELAPAFPIGESGDPGLDITEVRLLTTALSGLYTHIIQHLARHVALARSLDVQACEIILRESIVLVTYALADRTLRLVKALAQEKLEDLTVAAAQEYVWPETNSEFSALVEGSQNFNQFLICRLASSIFGIPTVTAPRALMGDVRNLKAVNNRNFDSPPPGIRALRKIARILSRFSGKVPALRLANIEGPLLDQGLYGFGKLRWLDPLRTPVPITRDPTLR